MIDTGNIKEAVINKLASNGYKVEEHLSQLIINNSIEIGFSDSLIEELVEENGYTVDSIYDMITCQYEYFLDS